MNILITRANQSGLTQQQYLQGVKDLVIQSQTQDPTLVLHSDQEILRRFKYSIIAVLNGEIIGNTSIYPTLMSPLDNLKIGERTLNIGECGSSVVKQEYREHGVGKGILNVAFQEFGVEFDAFVAATVNEIMFKIRQKMGFEQVPFPKKYFEEGKKYLAPKMKGGVQEFRSRAKCLIHFHRLNVTARQEIINTLLTQN